MYLSMGYTFGIENTNVEDKPYYHGNWKVDSDGSLVLIFVDEGTKEKPTDRLTLKRISDNQ